MWFFVVLCIFKVIHVRSYYIDCLIPFQKSKSKGKPLLTYHIVWLVLQMFSFMVSAISIPQGPFLQASLEPSDGHLQRLRSPNTLVLVVFFFFFFNIVLFLYFKKWSTIIHAPHLATSAAPSLQKKRRSQENRRQIAGDLRAAPRQGVLALVVGLWGVVWVTKHCRCFFCMCLLGEMEFIIYIILFYFLI